MWDYEKFFAIGNILGITYFDFTRPYIISNNADKEEILKKYSNKSLSYHGWKIQYIISLDDYGEIAEKIFDREKDIPSFMPELKTGMFVRVSEDNYSNVYLGYVDIENNRIVFQKGSFNFINGEHGIDNWKSLKIIEIYDINTSSFNLCDWIEPIWRDSEYQKYLNSGAK